MWALEEAARACPASIFHTGYFSTCYIPEVALQFTGIAKVTLAQAMCVVESCSHAAIRFTVVAIAVVAGVTDATGPGAAVWIGNTLRVRATLTFSFHALGSSNAVTLRVHAKALVAVAALEATVCVDALLVIDCALVVWPGTFVNILTVEACKTFVALDARVRSIAVVTGR